MADEVLRVTAGQAAGMEISPGDSFMIGRAESGQGALGDDPEISRRHAQIRRAAGGELMIEDLGSTNGTYVNGTQISTAVPLRSGDQIRIGKTTMQVTAGFVDELGTTRARETPPPASTEGGAQPLPPQGPFDAGTVLDAPAPEPPEPEPAVPEPEPLASEPPEPAPEPPEPAPEPPEPAPEPPEPEPLQVEAEPGPAEPVPMHVLDYLRSQKTLTLSTVGDDGPWGATHTYVNSGADIYVWTRPDTNTARHVTQNPTVAFTIDEYSGDWRQSKGIQGRGECSVLEGDQITVAAELFGDKFPDLRPGATSAVVFLKITPRTLEFIDNTRGVEESGDFGADFHRDTYLLPPYED